MSTALDKYAEMKPNWDYPVIIESHINGIRTKEMNPNTPISYEEIAEDAIRCWEAGAGAIHAHNTSFDLMGDDAYKDYMRTWDTVLSKHPNITWYPTTCNNLRLKGDENGVQYVPPLVKNANVRIACVDTGLTLFATEAGAESQLFGPEFGFNYERVSSQIRMLRELDAPMVFGVYEPGHLRHERYETQPRKPVFLSAYDRRGGDQTPRVHLDLGSGCARRYGDLAQGYRTRWSH